MVIVQNAESLARVHTHTHTHTHTSSIIKKYIIFSCPKIEDQVLM